MSRISIALIVLCSMFLSGCRAGGPSSNLHVELSDFAITPHEFTVMAGSETNIRITNNGAVVHDLSIMRIGVDVGEKFDQNDKPNVFWEAEVHPGHTMALSFVAPDQPGVYQIVCSMPGHLQAGMIGTLEVVK